jgi:hypothetical protein
MNPRTMCPYQSNLSTLDAVQGRDISVSDATTHGTQLPYVKLD